MKCTLFVTQIYLNEGLQKALAESVVTDEQCAPGQLRKKGNWYYLTFLKVSKVHQFDTATFELVPEERQNISVVPFRIIDGRLYVNGIKSCIKEIGSYLEALAWEVSSEEIDQMDDYYKLNNLEVDLKNILQKLEDKAVIENVTKLRVKPIEVSLGKINNCVINTDDYGKVRNLLDDEDNAVFGMEFSLKIPEKTLVYFDLDGQVRLSTKSKDIEDVESLTLEYAEMI